MYDLTAAHPTLPMGTRVLVTNLKNGRQAEVRINDRGPIVRGRIIDLSYAAARELRAVSDGTIAVRLRVLPAASANSSPFAFACDSAWDSRPSRARIGACA